MKPETDLLHVARPSKRNTQQTPQNVQQPTQQPRNKPASLKALAEGILSRSDRNSGCNSDATRLLHSPDSGEGGTQHRATGPELAVIDGGKDDDRLPDPEAEKRRQHVLTLLHGGKGSKYAVHVTDDTTDPVMIAFGVEGKVTAEVEIPRAKYDAFTLMELVERWTKSGEGA